MPDHVTLAHDNTKSGSWEPAKTSPYDAHLEGFRKATEDFESALTSGDMDRARDLAEMLDSVYGYHAYNADMDDRYIDIHRANDDNQKMNEMTREELGAKLETIEVKMDARVESVSSKIDGFLSAQTERDKRLDAALAQISKDNGETKAGISSMKTTLIVTAVSAVLAIVFGVAGFNTALTSNMMSAFQLGKSEQSSSAASQSSSPAKSESPPQAAPKS